MFTIESQSDSVVFAKDEQRLRLTFFTPSIVRISFTQGRPFYDRQSSIVCAPPELTDVRVEHYGDTFVLSTSALKVVLDKHSGALSYFTSSGIPLMREPSSGGKHLTPKQIFRNVFAQAAAVSSKENVDGARAVATKYETVFDRVAFEARLEFVFSSDEAIFGLGSHEEGYGNLRGRSRDLYQQNMKAVVPFFVSTRGYGVLLDCCSLMKFQDTADGASWWADAVDELHFYFIYGGDFDAVIRGYHHLTGPVPMLPKWAFGYMQSKERYVNARELLDVVNEYRRRRIPLDTVVLDWKSWPDGEGWGQKSFDPVRFPEPENFISQLHALHAHLMVSIWPIMTGGCADQREMLHDKLMLGNQSTYNAFLREARELYWQQAFRGLFSKGIDAWWCDCTEPFEADWTGAVKPEPEERLLRNKGESKLYLDTAEINAYSLLHSQGIYEGQRCVTDRKRVVNLTRSSYAGQHRYSTITWSGDICATWDTLRRSIPEGLNFCATGEPYWTLDIGGFFIGSNPDLWFWRGDYNDGCRGLTPMNASEPDPTDTGCRDLGYWELYVRWLQYAVFLPIFRSHGTDAPREIWRFGEPGTPFYDIIARFIRLRYQLLPYIYSLAAQITRGSASIIRAVALGFPHDHATHNLTDQFLLGPSLLVCPVTEPMHYGPQSTPIADASQSRAVYLPAGRRWFNFWSSEIHEGGKWITANAPLEIIPVFVAAGSILPMIEAMQYVDEIPDAPYEILVYTGVDAEFTLYEDAGDGYDYENGACSVIRLEWNEQSQQFTIAARQGKFPEMIAQREYRVTFISDLNTTSHSVLYKGDELRIRTPHN